MGTTGRTGETGSDRDPHPLVGALVVGVVASGLYFAWSLWWGPIVDHVERWGVALDTWMPVTAGIYVSHGAYQEVYFGSSGYFALPLSAILLAPVVRLGEAIGLVNGYPYPIPRPSMWWVVGPWVLAWGSLPVLYAARAVAWTAGLRRRLWVVQVAIAVFVVVPCLVWGHFEDSLAVAGVLLALRARMRGRDLTAALLVAVAICSKQWAVLAAPFFVLAAPRGQRLRMTAVMVGLPALLAAVPLAYHPEHTIRALLLQPTPKLAGRHVGHSSILAVLGRSSDRVARIAAVAAAAGLAWWACLRRPAWLLEVMAVALLVRPLTEPYLFGYYLAPGMALVLVATIVRSRRVDWWFAALCASPVIWALPNARGSNLTWWAGEVLLLGVCATGWWRIVAPGLHLATPTEAPAAAHDPRSSDREPEALPARAAAPAPSDDELAERAGKRPAGVLL